MYFAKDTETPITLDLTNVLPHLRTHNIRKAWANALCDQKIRKRRKGLETFNTKYILSRINTIYSRVGTQGSRNANGVPAIIISLINSNDRAVLTLSLHKCNWNNRHFFLLMPASLGILAAKVAEPKFFSTAITNISASVCYWKRRWIIQGIAVASRPIVFFRSLRMQDR